MKKLSCILLCFMMLYGSAVNTSAETVTDLSGEVVSESELGARPPYAEINNFSLTFYIVNGKAYASYSVSAKNSRCHS